MTGTASMPARLKATAEACKNAFLRDQTYPDAFQFADVRRYRFNQTNSRDFAKQLGDVTEPKATKMLSDLPRGTPEYPSLPLICRSPANHSVVNRGRAICVANFPHPSAAKER